MQDNPAYNKYEQQDTLLDQFYLITIRRIQIYFTNKRKRL